MLGKIKDLSFFLPYFPTHMWSYVYYGRSLENWWIMTNEREENCEKWSIIDFGMWNVYGFLENCHRCGTIPLNEPLSLIRDGVKKWHRIQFVRTWLYVKNKRILICRYRRKLSSHPKKLISFRMRIAQKLGCSLQTGLLHTQEMLH